MVIHIDILLKKWKNKQLSWSTLLFKLSKTRRTGETVAEYKSFAKSKQDDIKDVGGFVGGALKEGRRVAENVQWRSVITLDADFATNDFWDNLFFIMNKCDKSENQLFDSMIRFIKNGVLLVTDPHLAAKVAIIHKKWKSYVVLKCF